MYTLLIRIQVFIKRVAQRSVPGPFMFLLFVNDLLEYAISGSVITFADRTNVVDTAENSTQENIKIKKINYGMLEHQCHKNASKTNILYMSRKTPLQISKFLGFYDG